MIRVCRTPTGIFGRINFPGTRDFHFRIDRYKSPGSSSLSFHFSLLSKTQPDNALELSVRKARDSLDKMLGEKAQERRACASDPSSNQTGATIESAGESRVVSAQQGASLMGFSKNGKAES